MPLPGAPPPLQAVATKHGAAAPPSPTVAVLKVPRPQVGRPSDTVKGVTPVEEPRPVPVGRTRAGRAGASGRSETIVPR